MLLFLQLFDPYFWCSTTLKNLQGFGVSVQTLWLVAVLLRYDKISNCSVAKDVLWLCAYDCIVQYR